MVLLDCIQGTAYSFLNEVIYQLPSAQVNQTIYMENVRRSGIRARKSIYPHTYGSKAEVLYDGALGTKAMSNRHPSEHGRHYATADPDKNVKTVYHPPADLKTVAQKIQTVKEYDDLLNNGAKLFGDANLN